MITLEEAKKAVSAAQEKAKELDISITVAVVDSYGVLKALERMDTALVISPDFAGEKAYTSATLKVPTSGLASYALPEKPYYGINSMFGGKLTSIAGGVPVVREGAVVGAVGVGGAADVSLDEECAKAAVDAIS